MPGLNCEGSLRPLRRSKLWPPVVAVDVGRLRMRDTNAAATGGRKGAAEAAAVDGTEPTGSAPEDSGSIAAVCLRWRNRRTKRSKRMRSTLSPATPPTTLPATAPGDIASLLPDEMATPGDEDAEGVAVAADPIPATPPVAPVEIVSALDEDGEVIELKLDVTDEVLDMEVVNKVILELKPPSTAWEADEADAIVEAADVVRGMIGSRNTVVVVAADVVVVDKLEVVGVVKELEPGSVATGGVGIRRLPTLLVSMRKADAERGVFDVVTGRITAVEAADMDEVIVRSV